jgi:hypothetical protein
MAAQAAARPEDTAAMSPAGRSWRFGHCLLMPGQRPAAVAEGQAEQSLHAAWPAPPRS